MGWLSKVRPDAKCTRCRRLLKACICGQIVRGEVKRSHKAKVDPRPHLCPRPGCGRTVRAGICPGPDC